MANIVNYLLSLSPKEYQQAKENWMQKHNDIARRWHYHESLDEDSKRRFTFLCDIMDYADLIMSPGIDNKSKISYCYEFRRALTAYLTERNLSIQSPSTFLPVLAKSQSWMADKGFIDSDVAKLDLDKVYNITLKLCLNYGQRSTNIS